YAAARDGVFPEALAKIDRKTGAPRRALVFLIVMVLLSLGAFYILNVDFVSAFLMASGAAILTYVIGSVAGIRRLEERGVRRSLTLSRILPPPLSCREPRVGSVCASPSSAPERWAPPMQMHMRAFKRRRVSRLPGS